MLDDELEKSWLPDILYHVTPKENLKSILQTGIKLNTIGQSFLNRNYKTPRVYLATSLIAAYEIQTNFNSHEGKDYVILELDTKKLNGPFFNDELYLHGIYTHSKVNKQAILKTIDPNTLIFQDTDLENMYNQDWLEYDAPLPTIREDILKKDILREAIVLKRFQDL